MATTFKQHVLKIREKLLKINFLENPFWLIFKAEFTCEKKISRKKIIVFIVFCEQFLPKKF